MERKKDFNEGRRRRKPAPAKLAVKLNYGLLLNHPRPIVIPLCVLFRMVYSFFSSGGPPVELAPDFIKENVADGLSRPVPKFTLFTIFLRPSPF